MATREGRNDADHRPVEVEVGFQSTAEGSVLYRAGGTVVLCTASVDDGVPKWMNDNDGGWLTAEYQMHPRASPHRRQNREGRGRPPKGRTMEIQRLIGRSLRSALNLERLGPRTITLDCDVLEADGGTRTASVTGGFIATVLAIHHIGLIGVVRDQIAAISVGHLDGGVLVDLDYEEDSAARVDMNVVATADGRLVEVQGTAEGVPIERASFDAMLAGALDTVARLCAMQRDVLTKVDVDLDMLMKRVS